VLSSIPFREPLYEYTPDGYELEVGDFITIPAWSTGGMVTRIEMSEIGPDGTIKVWLQEDPDSEKTRVFRLEPGQYEIEG
jgi:hypothetical protein